MTAARNLPTPLKPSGAEAAKGLCFNKCPARSEASRKNSVPLPQPASSIKMLIAPRRAHSSPSRQFLADLDSS